MSSILGALSYGNRRAWAAERRRRLPSLAKWLSSFTRPGPRAPRPARDALRKKQFYPRSASAEQASFRDALPTAVALHRDDRGRNHEPGSNYFHLAGVDSVRAIQRDAPQLARLLTTLPSPRHTYLVRSPNQDFHLALFELGSFFERPRKKFCSQRRVSCVDLHIEPVIVWRAARPLPALVQPQLKHPLPGSGKLPNQVVLKRVKGRGEGRRCQRPRKWMALRS